MAWEYHWYRRQDFHTTLEATYRSPDSPRARNRIWLCKVMAVLALGESYNSYEPPLINLSQTPETSVLSAEKSNTRNPYLPGVRFFEQALSLFKMPSEEPEIEHVEALNLIVSSVLQGEVALVVSHIVFQAFFCYSLNRRKTAYMYAGMSARIANSLMLHRPTMTDGPVVAEYRKRVWWTTFLMDTMVSSEMGLRASVGFAQAEHAFPSDEQIHPIHRADFWDSYIMTAHLKLCNIRVHILETVGQIQESDFASYERVIAVPLQELDVWKTELSPLIVFDFSNGVPQQMLDLPSMRSLASLYLRYHQVRIPTQDIG
jgi:proline utilization trans-activator